MDANSVSVCVFVVSVVACSSLVTGLCVCERERELELETDSGERERESVCLSVRQANSIF
jgi:hypothetical protein